MDELTYRLESPSYSTHYSLDIDFLFLCYSNRLFIRLGVLPLYPFENPYTHCLAFVSASEKSSGQAF